eukprot:jgi/Mesvir1/17105/Mv07540-RA.1
MFWTITQASYNFTSTDSAMAEFYVCKKISHGDCRHGTFCTRSDAVYNWCRENIGSSTRSTGCHPLYKFAVRSTMSGDQLPFYDYSTSSSKVYAPPPAYGPSGGFTSFNNFADEPPLLEELGINFSDIWKKTMAVLHPLRRRLDTGLMEEGDLSGPLLFCLMLGGVQLLAGKLYFGYILGWGVMAAMFLYATTNLLAGRQGEGVDLYRCCSVVGYCLLPMVVFSAICLLLPHRGPAAVTAAVLAVGWAARSSSSMLVSIIQADDMYMLVAYPCALVFSAFALLIFF